MSPIRDFGRGPGYLWRGFTLLREPRLRAFVAAPVAINVILIVALVWLLGNRLDVWLDAWLAGLPTWLAWLESVLWWLALLLGILLFCYFFTLLANLIASPFNGLLSARVERLLTGRDPESGMSAAGEIADALTGELRRLAYYLSRAAGLGLLSLVLLFVPLLNGLVPLLWFAFGAYMLAFEYLDNPMGNHGMAFAEKSRWLREHRWLGLGFGSAVTLITALPLVNLLVMPAAVAGATALWVERMQEQGRVGN